MHLTKPYSAECVEAPFPELRAEGVLRSSPRDLAFLGIVTSASIRSFRSEIFRSSARMSRKISEANRRRRRAEAP